MAGLLIYVSREFSRATRLSLKILIMALAVIVILYLYVVAKAP
jgi:hypothetical protein